MGVNDVDADDEAAAIEQGDQQDQPESVEAPAEQAGEGAKITEEIGDRRGEQTESVTELLEMGPSAQWILGELDQMAGISDESDTGNVKGIYQVSGQVYGPIAALLEKAQGHDKTGSINPFLANTGLGLLRDADRTFQQLSREGAFGINATPAQKHTVKSQVAAMKRAIESLPDDFRSSDNIIKALNKMDG